MCISLLPVFHSSLTALCMPPPVYCFYGSILVPPKNKIPSQLKQNIVYQWSCPEENCSLSYIGLSSRCLENRVKEHNTSVTSAVYKHSISNDPEANISNFKIIDQDSKEFMGEARDAIHIRVNNPALNSIVIQEKCTFQKSSTTFLEQTDLPMSLTKW